MGALPRSSPPTPTSTARPRGSPRTRSPTPARAASRCSASPSRRPSPRDFTARLLHEVAALGVGDPREEGVVCGPLIDDAAATRLTAWIEEAVADGARLLAGGDADGRLLAPTVLADVPHRARLIQQEAFGPVVSVNRFATLADAFARANDTPFGLQAAVFTGSLATALRAAQALEFGGVLVNEAPTFRADHMPYGGGGDSGNTREGPRAVVRELTEERLVVIDLPTDEDAP